MSKRVGALLAVASLLAAGVVAMDTPVPAHADPANDDAVFYQYLLDMGGLVSLRAREHFPLIRQEALANLGG
jgi:hypothetical protein